MQVALELKNVKKSLLNCLSVTVRGLSFGLLQTATRAAVLGRERWHTQHILNSYIFTKNISFLIPNGP